ncbi:MAG: MotA/TolQ/ExbB proton channel family protein [Opitutaceae bacterium]|nr:MotA/TolQ/ExbB proton channel family protein [Verrucomicrobiales bacterium]
MTSFFLPPLFASGALQFAFEKSTLEGKITIGSLLVLSLFSWTIILTKFYQLYRARKMSKKFYAAYSSTRDPMEIFRKGEEFDGAPAYQLYVSGAEELSYHLKNNPVDVSRRARPDRDAEQFKSGETDLVAKSISTKIHSGSFDAVKVTLEEAAAAEAMSLEKGMIVLSTAVSGGPFIGLLGTVWGVMETFAGIARANSASLTAMAPGVAGALIATVIGLLVAIPAMFAYNFMVTSIRAITQELDGFASRYATQIDHKYVDNRALGEEVKEANAELAERIVIALRSGQDQLRDAPVLSNRD